MLANDRSKPAIMRLVNMRQSSTNVRWANDRPGLRTCALGFHLTRQARGHLKSATLSFPVEAGNYPTAMIRVLGFLGFPSGYI
jgi:hypothetical protein